MEATASLRLASLLVASAMGIAACSAREEGSPGAVDDGSSDSGTRSDSGTPGLGYETSPIVFGSFDPLGTFFVTVDSGKAERVNGNYSVLSTTLSPLRTRFAQVTDGPHGEARSVVEVHAIAPAGPLLGSFPVPGGMLGWSGDDALLFATIEGVIRTRIDGVEREMRFPDWVKRQTNGLLGNALSPDGKSAAFLVSTEGQPATPDGLALFVTNTGTGAVTDIWPIPPEQWPGRVIWARDGRIVYYSFVQPALMATRSGAASLSAPVDLPFKPCEVGHWMNAGTLHMRELVTVDGETACVGGWLVDTDGSNPRVLNSVAPMAFSPDGRKILVFDVDGQLATADPDGSGQTSIVGISKVNWAVW
jgi:hypothetical protein